ncbi:glia maturation factor beta [Conidiobolus coronatus NRRL 28638]|uniref:Glia maturation factor beta n=1 Tax=Conidiobolus coronatus (strain ATCC 28846 / CBS 209.66 / NRRL 28638) TaxID=796925 RepID=A0A137PHB5_CONC2|nr:glia maturation factor beta [Conidiobolus coronatus NRRL 28638]|eukprot:KXN74394.1 glia maturation factor beta [Conidiobolus coronatus NRRL 28638]
MSDVALSCKIPTEVIQAARKFRFLKNPGHYSGLILKINKETSTVEVDENLIDCDLEEIIEELPDDAPRYVLLSYKYEREDGITQYPLIFLYYIPEAASHSLNMLYASTQNNLQKEIDMSRVFEIRDLEELDEEWIKSRLSKF